ncbi:unnamed protein product [Schistosoma mattheei]|uniref:Uncharacterized protein n=1 Tax=Schistosoma mattheei TaxID=31246 RepID=A0A183PB14_9TREM|nr:unnamed protein product [Schistosoma mattheei]
MRKQVINRMNDFSQDLHEIIFACYSNPIVYRLEYDQLN